jgi:hypothetical protein
MALVPEAPDKGTLESVRVQSGAARMGPEASPAGRPRSAREGPAVPDKVVLILRFHPVGGEDVSVLCRDFSDEREALEAVAHAIDEHHSLILNEARYEREPEENGVVINLANVVSMRVSKTDGAATGQYL